MFSVIWRDQRKKNPIFGHFRCDWVRSSVRHNFMTINNWIARKIFRAFEISRSAHKLICKIEIFMLIESASKCDCGWFPFFANLAHANCRESRIHHEFASIIGDDALLFMMNSIPTGGREAQPRAHRRRERNNFISFFLPLLCLNYLGKHNSRFRQFITWLLGVEENWIINILCCSVGFATRA